MNQPFVARKSTNLHKCVSQMFYAVDSFMQPIPNPKNLYSLIIAFFIRIPCKNARKNSRFISIHMYLVSSRSDDVNVLHCSCSFFVCCAQQLVCATLFINSSSLHIIFFYIYIYIQLFT